MRRVWSVVAALVCAALLAGQVAAQGRTAIFEGTVVDDQGQPDPGRLVVVFMNGREVGRNEVTCTADGCRFEIVVADNTNIGQVGRDGLVHVPMDTLHAGVPKVVQGTPPSGPRVTYVVLALTVPAASLPQAMQQGRLGLFPDGGVVVIEDTRPPDLPRPAAASPVAQLQASGAFPWLAASLLALVCCLNLLGLIVLVGLGVLVARRQRSSQTSQATV